MKTFIMTVLGIIMTVSISSADIIDDMFAKASIAETTTIVKQAMKKDLKYDVRFGMGIDLEVQINEFLKTTDFVFFKKWADTKPGTRCCTIWDTSDVYSVCIDGILLVVGRISD